MEFRAIFIVAVSGAGVLFSFWHAIYGLYAYLWFAYFRVQDLASWVPWLFKLRLSFCIATAVIIGSFLQREKIFYPHRLSHLLLLFWFLTLLSAVFSSVAAVSWRQFEEMSKVFIIGCLIMGLVNTRQKFHQTCTTIALCLAFFGVKVGIFSLQGGEILQGPGGILGDNNAFAMVLVMSIPFLYYLGYTYKGWKRWAFHYSIPFVIWGVIGTQSRGGFLALVSLLIIMMIYTGKKLRGYMMIVGLFAVCSWPFLPQDYKERLGTILVAKESIEKEESLEEAEGESSAMSRVHFWKVAWVMAKENPLFGTGLATYRHRYNNYDYSNGFYGRNRAVHNSYMEVLADNGFICFGIYLLLFMTAFFENQKIRKEAKSTPDLQWTVPYTYMIQTSLAAFLVGSIFISVAYGDLPYHIICLVVALRHAIDSEARTALTFSTNPAYGRR